MALEREPKRRRRYYDYRSPSRRSRGAVGRRRSSERRGRPRPNKKRLDAASASGLASDKTLAGRGYDSDPIGGGPRVPRRASAPPPGKGEKKKRRGSEPNAAALLTNRSQHGVSPSRRRRSSAPLRSFQAGSSHQGFPRRKRVSFPDDHETTRTDGESRPRLLGRPKAQKE
jgi:hypothetical protein